MLSRPWRRPLIAPQLECPQTMMSRTSSKPTANSMAAASDSSPTESPSGAAGETMLPGLRTTKRSPGSVEANTLIATRLSEQAMKSTSGFCPSASRAKVSRAMGRTRLRKSTMPWTSLRIPWLPQRKRNIPAQQGTQACTFDASRSTCSILGGSDRSSPARFISAAAMGPLRCAFLPFSSGNASKMPNSAGPKRSANHTGVCGSAWAAGRAPARNFSNSPSLPGLARRRTNSATLVMGPPQSSAVEPNLRGIGLPPVPTYGVHRTDGHRPDQPCPGTAQRPRGEGAGRQAAAGLQAASDRGPETAGPAVEVLASLLFGSADLGALHHLDACRSHLLHGPRDVARLQLDAARAVLDQD